MSTCGRPAVPSTRARPRLTKSSFVVPVRPYCAPGSSDLLAAGLDRAAEQRGQVEAVLAEHPDGHDERADDQQRRLDDLHVRGAAHAADEDVEDHQRADEGDDERPRAAVTADPEQQGDQATGARHLGQQVEQRDRERRDRRRRAHRPLAHPEGQDVGHREPGRVAHQLGDQQQRHQPRDEEADRVQEAVVAVDGDGAGDAEERRRREVVAGDGQAVLLAGDGAAGGVVVGGALVVAAGAEGDGQRDEDEARRRSRC